MVEVGGGVEPEVEPHFPADDAAVAASSHVHVRLQSVWLTRSCAEELDVNLVVEARVSLIVRELQAQPLVHERDSKWY